MNAIGHVHALRAAFIIACPIKRSLTSLIAVAMMLMLAILLPAAVSALPAPPPSSLIVKLVAGLSASEQAAVIALPSDPLCSSHWLSPNTPRVPCV